MALTFHISALWIIDISFPAIPSLFFLPVTDYNYLSATSKNVEKSDCQAFQTKFKNIFISTSDDD